MADIDLFRASPPMAGSEPLNSTSSGFRWQTLAINLSVWTLFGLLFALQRYLERAYSGNPTSLGRVLTAWAACAYLWAALTPIVFRLSRAFPIGRRTWQRSLVVQVLAGVVISTVHLILYLAALQFLFGNYSFASLESLREMVVNEIHFNLLVYSAIVAAAHFIDHHYSHRRQKHVADDLARELAEVRNESRESASDESFVERIPVKVKDKVLLVDVDEIDWIEAQDNYVRLYCGREAYMLRETLSGLTARLDPSKFLRIRRSVVVNVERIKELHPLFNREYVIVLKDGTRLQSTRRFRQNLNLLLNS